MTTDMKARILEAIADAGNDGIAEAALERRVASYATPAQIADLCQDLMRAGEILRRGSDTQAQPYTYHLPDDGTPRL